MESTDKDYQNAGGILRNGFLVEIQSPKTTNFEVYNSVYPYFASLIGLYNPNADIEKYE